MLIRTFVFDRINCVWRVQWLTQGKWAALRHITKAMIPAVCTGIVIVTPPIPPAFATPPPPAEYTPPPASWSPPSTPIGGYPPAFGYVPPADIYTPPVTPIPTGPVFPESGGETFSPAGIAPETVGKAGPAAPTHHVPLPMGFSVFPERMICDTPPESTPKVPEPAGVLFLGMGLAIIGLLRYARPVEPKVRVTILSMEAK